MDSLLKKRPPDPLGTRLSLSLFLLFSFLKRLNLGTFRAFQQQQQRRRRERVTTAQNVIPFCPSTRADESILAKSISNNFCLNISLYSRSSRSAEAGKLSDPDCT